MVWGRMLALSSTLEFFGGLDLGMVALGSMTLWYRMYRVYRVYR